MKQGTGELLALDLVAALRREIPGLGTTKLHLLLQSSFKKSGIKMGRDKLHALLKFRGLLVTQKRTIPKTTNSCHWMKKYPDLIKDVVVQTTERVWVCDLTYICVGYDFNYLSLITDAHSRKIMGFCLHPFLTTEGCLNALNMALSTKNKNNNRLIHHSDRGSQYCSFEYVNKLRNAEIDISMTQSGSPYENAMAERVNGILKHDFKLNRVFKSHMEALQATASAIANYNNLRPHMSCNYMTPALAHELDIPIMKKHW